MLLVNTLTDLVTARAVKPLKKKSLENLCLTLGNYSVVLLNFISTEKTQRFKPQKGSLCLFRPGLLLLSSHIRRIRQRIRNFLIRLPDQSEKNKPATNIFESDPVPSDACGKANLI